MRHLHLLIYFFGLCSGMVFAGDYTLTLADALDMASRNNHDMALAEAETNQMHGDYQKSYSVFLPQVTLSETYTTTNDPLNVFGLKLKQEVVSQSDFNPALLNDPDRIENFTTKLELRQPLINVDGWLGRSAISHARQASEFKQKRTAAYVTFQVKMSYFQLALARRSLEVIDKALEAAHSGRSQAEAYFNEGMIHRSDVLFAEVRLLELENKRLEVENAIHTASDRLRLLTGIRQDVSIVTVDSLLSEPVEITPIDAHQLNRTRSDMLAMKSGVTASHRLSTMARMKFLPSLNAFGSYEWNDTRIFGRQGTNWMAGVMLKWDILSGFDQIGDIHKSRAKAEHARVSFEKAAEQNIHELQASYRQLDVATRSLSIARKAVTHAEENYRILSDRYAKGLERTTDLLAAEASLSQMRLQLLQAQFGYSAAVFMIELLTEQSIIR